MNRERECRTEDTSFEASPVRPVAWVDGEQTWHATAGRLAGPGTWDPRSSSSSLARRRDFASHGKFLGCFIIKPFSTLMKCVFRGSSRSSRWLILPTRLSLEWTWSRSTSQRPGFPRTNNAVSGCILSTPSIPPPFCCCCPARSEGLSKHARVATSTN